MTRDEAKEKIGKLLALAKRPGTPAEGEVAMRKAQSLADIYGFTIRKVVGGVQTDRQPTGGMNGNMPEWLVRYVNKHGVKKARTEYRRRESMRWTAYWDGFDVGSYSWSTIFDCPYERAVVWGVPIMAEWKRGFGDAKQGKGGDF